MRAILGIDAAWTLSAGSGVALAVEEGHRWRCAALAPTFFEFEALAKGTPVSWDVPPGPVGSFSAARLAAAAGVLAPGLELAVVTVDMPLSRHAITARRACDDAVSREFGGRGCGTHTPSALRPGPISATVRDGFASLGVPLRTATAEGSPAPALLEVYPHTALLTLMGASYRVPYKASKTLTYWPGCELEDRQQRLAVVWRDGLGQLDEHLDTGFTLPGPRPFARLKRYEDALDALVCAWVGIEYLSGRTRAFGDGAAAIWTPVA